MSDCRNRFYRTCLGMFLFFLSSCSPPSRQWSFSDIKTPEARFCSSRLLLPSDNEYRGLEIVIDSGYCGERYYLHASSLPFQPDANGNCRVLLTFENDSIEVDAHCFKGGQRLLLPQEIGQRITAALLNGKPLTIQTGRYRTELVPANFNPQYRRFMKSKTCRKNSNLR